MDGKTQTVGAECRQIVRAAAKAVLGTLDAKSGAPFCSLVAVATAGDGTPVMLMSTLARHTGNAASDPRASLLFETAGREGAADDFLDRGRITLSGELERWADDHGRARFLARHPASAQFAGFADFSIFRLKVKSAYFVAGFGRVRTLKGEQFLLAQALAGPVAEAEAELLSSPTPPTLMLGGEAWRLVGCDCEGADVMREGMLRRVIFPQAVGGGDELRRALESAE